MGQRGEWKGGGEMDTWCHHLRCQDHPRKPSGESQGRPAHFFHYSFHHRVLRSSRLPFFPPSKITEKNLPLWPGTVCPRPRLGGSQPGWDQPLRDDAFASCWEPRTTVGAGARGSRIQPRPAGSGQLGVQSWRLQQSQANALSACRPGDRASRLSL